MILWLLVGVAAALSAEDARDSLEAYTIEACSAEQVEIAWLGLAEHLPGGEGTTYHWEGDPCRPHPLLRVAAVDGEGPVGRWTLRPSLEIWVRRPVVERQVVAGESVSITEGLVRIETLVGSPVEEGNWVARVNLAAGEPVTTAVVSLMPDAESGSEVTVRYRSSQVTITTTGTLLQDAHVGAEVRVASHATRVVLKGRLSSPDTVDLY